MNKIIPLFALSFLLVACSKEETPVAADETTTVESAEEQVVEAAESLPESSVPDTESLVVVEESAADDEPADKTIVLAVADDAVDARSWKYKEGDHFTRMVPTQPTVGGPDKIEVAELFMYTCPHCRDLEGFVNRWEETKSPGVRLVRIPVMFNNLARLHAQLYYTEEVLARNGTLADHIAFRNMVFNDIHSRGNYLESESAIQKIFERAGVSKEDFDRTWNSFEVDQAMRVGADLARRYNINSVPMIVVNGKYRTNASMAGGYPKLIEVVDELTAREGLR